MYIIFLLPHEVFEEDRFKKLRLSSKYLYCYLSKLKNQYQDSQGWFWYKMTQLSIETNMNLKTVKKAKKELLQNNFIEIRRGNPHESRGPVHFYRILGFPLTTSEEREILTGNGRFGRY